MEDEQLRPAQPEKPADGELETKLASLSVPSEQQMKPSVDDHGLKDLCAACQRLVSDEVEIAEPCSFKSIEELNRSKDEFHIKEQWLVHHPSGGRGLRDAATTGCPVCRHIWLSMSKDDREKICPDTSNSGFASSDFVTRYKVRFQTNEEHLAKYCIMEYRIRTLHKSQNEKTGRCYIRLDNDVKKDFYMMPCEGTSTVPSTGYGSLRSKF
jgi:hypothetical protein